jgi:hypothetical protein
MKKIYAVSSGSYSDYRVDLIFTDRKKSEEYCSIENSSFDHIYYDDKFRVEEFYLVDKEKINRIYIARIISRNGDMNISVRAYIGNPSKYTRPQTETKLQHCWDPRYKTRIAYMEFISRCIDQKLAEKSVQDKFKQYKAEKELGYIPSPTTAAKVIQ